MAQTSCPRCGTTTEETVSDIQPSVEGRTVFHCEPCSWNFEVGAYIEPVSDGSSGLQHQGG